MILFSTKGNTMNTEKTEQNSSNINQQTQSIRRAPYAETDFDLAIVSSSMLQQLLSNNANTTTQSLEPLAELSNNLSSYFLPPQLESTNDTDTANSVSVSGDNSDNTHDHSVLL